MEPEIPLQESLLSDFISQNIHSSWYAWAMTNYKATIGRLIQTFQFREVLEIGGGRAPLLGEAEAKNANLHYTINDIAEARFGNRNRRRVQVRLLVGAGK